MKGEDYSGVAIMKSEEVQQARRMGYEREGRSKGRRE